MVTLRRAAPASPQAAGAQGGSAQVHPAGDETVREFLAAGGRRGLTTDQIFPAVAG